MHAEWIDPERVRIFGIPGGHMAGCTLVEAERGEKPEAGRQALLAMQTFFLNAGECRQGEMPEKRAVGAIVAVA